ncbi:MAG: hypothetical protein ACP5GI_02405 [Sulfolobales archaeon]
MRAKREIELFYERSRSRRNLHAKRRFAYVICGDSISEPTGLRTKVKTLYSIGEAYSIKIALPENCYAAQVDLVMNPRKRVKGYISIYDYEGKLVLRMKYSKLKFRVSYGDSRYKDIFSKLINFLKIPYKNINWRKP